MDAITTVNLTKKYKSKAAVNALNLSVRQGELFALLGVNGAGKTTTVKLLCCLTKADSGDALVLGNSVNSPSEVKKLIAISPQETAIAANLTVRENLEFICGVYGIGKQKTKEKIAELSAKLGLDPVMTKKSARLSGGWQRRLSIAMALVSEPKVLFLDEPSLGLDVLSREELHDVIRELKGKTTTVLTTHYMEEAEALADRVGIMKNGKLLAVGTVDELKKITDTVSLEKAFIAIVKEETA